MTLLEAFIVNFIASFLGSSIAIIVALYLYKKQIEQMRKLKISLQNTVRRLKEK